ncbi:MAG: hypothetical protein HRT88_11060, partial [Lentisphaeraceae bacterium]|nr:hypothetical protein [Lentisphaeraceae bacterium]
LFGLFQYFVGMIDENLEEEKEKSLAGNMIHYGSNRYPGWVSKYACQFYGNSKYTGKLNLFNLKCKRQLQNSFLFGKAALSLLSCVITAPVFIPWRFRFAAFRPGKLNLESVLNFWKPKD